MKIQKSDSRIFSLIKKIRIAVLSLGTAILFFACNNNELDKIQAFTSFEELPILEITNFKTLHTDSGVVRFSLEAPLLLRFENGGKTFDEFSQGMHLIRFKEKREITSSIRADYAKKFPKEKKWEAKNNVVITNEAGDSLQTEHLIWMEKEEKIFTEEYVKIIRSDQIITGVGLTSDQSMTNWKIKKPKGIIYVTVDDKQQQSNNTNNEAAPVQPIMTEPAAPKAIKFK